MKRMLLQEATNILVLSYFFALVLEVILSSTFPALSRLHHLNMTVQPSHLKLICPVLSS